MKSATTWAATTASIRRNSPVPTRRSTPIPRVGISRERMQCPITPSWHTAATGTETPTRKRRCFPRRSRLIRGPLPAMPRTATTRGISGKPWASWRPIVLMYRCLSTAPVTARPLQRGASRWRPRSVWHGRRRAMPPGSRSLPVPAGRGTGLSPIVSPPTRPVRFGSGRLTLRGTPSRSRSPVELTTSGCRSRTSVGRRGMQLSVFPSGLRATSVRAGMDRPR